MKMLEICKKARDEKWSDEKIELEVLRAKQGLIENIVSELANFGKEVE